MQKLMCHSKGFALLYFEFEGNFQVPASQGAYIWRGDLTESFLEGLIFRVLQYFTVLLWNVLLLIRRAD